MRIIWRDLKGGTYFARLVLSTENELKQKKIIEIDARPSFEDLAEITVTIESRAIGIVNRLNQLALRIRTSIKNIPGSSATKV